MKDSTGILNIIALKMLSAREIVSTCVWTITTSGGALAQKAITGSGCPRTDFSVILYDHSAFGSVELRLLGEYGFVEAYWYVPDDEDPYRLESYPPLHRNVTYDSLWDALASEFYWFHQYNESSGETLKLKRML